MITSGTPYRVCKIFGSDVEGLPYKLINCLIYTPIPYQVQIHPSLAGGSDSYLIVPARFISLLRDLNPSDSLPVETQAQFLFKSYTGLSEQVPAIRLFLAPGSQRKEVFWIAGPFVIL